MDLPGIYHRYSPRLQDAMADVALQAAEHACISFMAPASLVNPNPPKPNTLNPSTITHNPEPPTRNPQSYHLNPEPQTLNPDPQTLSHELYTFAA